MAGGLALALSGGGARGAFQVGVLDELINVHGVEFETVAGTSTGAIQAAAVAQKELDRLISFWEGINGNSSIYNGSDSVFSIAWALIRGKEAIFDPAPLRELLREMYKDDVIANSNIKLRMEMVNLVTGELRTVANNAGNIADWVYASSAQPPFFPPLVDSAGNQWVDGGVRDVIPLNAALKERPRAVLVVRANAPLPPAPGELDGLIEVGLRSVELQTNEVARSDVANVKLMNELLDAADEQRTILAQQGLSPSQITDAMEPLQTRFDDAFFARTMVLQPQSELYPTLEFDKGLITDNMERGRKTVRDKWPDIAAFLGVPE